MSQIFSKINKAVTKFNNWEIVTINTQKPSTHNRPIGDWNFSHNAPLRTKLYTVFFGEALVTGELDF